MKSTTATALVAFAAAAISSSGYAAPISEPIPSVNPLAPAPPPSTGNASAPAPAPGPPASPINPFSGAPPSGPPGPPSSHGSFGMPPPSSFGPPPSSSSDSNPNLLEDANIMQGIRTGIKEGLKVTLSQTLNVPMTDDLVKDSEVTQVINCIGAEPLNTMISCMRDQHLSSTGADTSPFPSVASEDLLTCINPSDLNRMEYCVSKVQVQRLAQDAHIFQQMYNGANLKAQEFAMNYPFLPQPGSDPDTELTKATKPLFDTHWVDAHKDVASLKGPSGPGASFGGPIGLPKGYDDDLLSEMPPPSSSPSKGPAVPPSAPADDEDFDEEDFLSKLPPPSTAKGATGVKGDEDFDDEEFLSKLPPPSSKGANGTKTEDEKPSPASKGPADSKDNAEDEFDEEDFLSRLPPPSSAKGPAGEKGDVQDDDADFDQEDFLSKLPPPPSSKEATDPTKGDAQDKEDALAKLSPSSASSSPSDLKDTDDDFLKSLHLPEDGKDKASVDAPSKDDAAAPGAPSDKENADDLGDFEDDDDSYLYDDENDYLLPPYDDKPSNGTAPADPKLDAKVDVAKPALAPLPPFDPKELEKFKDGPAPPLAKRKYGYGPDWETALGVRDGHPLPRRR